MREKDSLHSKRNSSAWLIDSFVVEFRRRWWQATRLTIANIDTRRLPGFGYGGHLPDDDDQGGRDDSASFCTLMSMSRTCDRVLNESTEFLLGERASYKFSSSGQQGRRGTSWFFTEERHSWEMQNFLRWLKFSFLTVNLERMVILRTFAFVQICAFTCTCVWSPLEFSVCWRIPLAFPFVHRQNWIVSILEKRFHRCPRAWIDDDCGEVYEWNGRMLLLNFLHSNPSNLVICPVVCQSYWLNHHRRLRVVENKRNVLLSQRTCRFRPMSTIKDSTTSEEVGKVLAFVLRESFEPKLEFPSAWIRQLIFNSFLFEFFFCGSLSFLFGCRAD